MKRTKHLIAIFVTLIFYGTQRSRCWQSRRQIAKTCRSRLPTIWLWPHRCILTMILPSLLVFLFQSRAWLGPPLRIFLLSFHNILWVRPPLLVPLRPSSEIIDDPSKLACLLFRDGGWWIFHCARPTRAFGGRALREHRRSSGSIPSSAPGAQDQ